jgi:hypothetical protein
MRDPNRSGKWPIVRRRRNWPAIGAILLIMLGIVIALLLLVS